MQQEAQLVELAGRHRLISELLTAGLEISIPVRDRGIDLIAYADLEDQVQRFTACPIQMKAASTSSFSIASKYKRFPNLLLAYVWYLKDSSKAVTYALSYSEALAIAKKVGWTKTASWEKGLYVSNKPSPKLISLLNPYVMTPARWREKVLGLSVKK